MTVSWTREAIGDRAAIYAFIEKDNPRAALLLDEQISSRASQLERFPQLGRPGRVSGTRELVVHPNYVLIYATRGTKIRIIRLLHASRRWPPGD